MKPILAFIASVFLLIVGASAFAQTVQAPGNNGQLMPAEAMCFGALGSNATCVDAGHPLPTGDVNGAAFRSETPMTLGATYPAGRSLKLLCPTPTTLTVTYAAGGSGQWAVTGLAAHQTLPIAVTAVTAATTACTSYANLN